MHAWLYDAHMGSDRHPTRICKDILRALCAGGHWPRCVRTRAVHSVWAGGGMRPCALPAAYGWHDCSSTNGCVCVRALAHCRAACRACMVGTCMACKPALLPCSCCWAPTAPTALQTNCRSPGTCLGAIPVGPTPGFGLFARSSNPHISYLPRISLAPLAMIIR